MRGEERRADVDKKNRAMGKIDQLPSRIGASPNVMQEVTRTQRIDGERGQVVMVCVRIKPMHFVVQIERVV